MNYDASEGNPIIPSTPMMNSGKGCPPAIIANSPDKCPAFVVFGQVVLPYLAIGAFGPR